MKKLMTTLSAVAVAFGLYASGPLDTGTSFEGIEIPEGESSVTLDINDDTGELDPAGAGNTYWVSNENATLTVISNKSTTAEGARPKQYLYADQERYLNIKTTLGNPVTRKVSATGSGTEVGSGGYYFDSLVRFTAFDSDPTALFADDNGRTVITNGGKIAIWLKENLDPVTDLPTSTNLMITAGYLVNGSVVATNYECIVVGDNVNINDGGWHRVTVMAIDNIYDTTPSVPGFIVYVDRCYVASLDAAKGIDSSKLDSFYYGFNEAHALFPSAVQGEDDYKSIIRAVDFDGQGDVDDLVFTTDKPTFIEEVECFTIKIGDGVESVTLETYNASEQQIAKGCGTFTSDLTLVYEPDMYVLVTGVNYADGYDAAGVATNGYVEVDAESDKYMPQEGNTGIEIKAKRLGATIISYDGTFTNTYETVAEAIADIKAGEVPGHAATITLSAAVTDGITLDDSLANVTIDLAGNSVTGVVGDAAISLIKGTMLITNSTVAVGHVVGIAAEPEPGDEELPVAVAAAVEDGFLTIAGGYFDGVVPENSELIAITGDVKIRIAENAKNLSDLVDCVIPDSYTLDDEEGEDPVYYVVVAGEPTTKWTVTFYGFDGVTSIGSVEVVDGQAVTTVPECPEVPGYTASGWLLNDQLYDLETLVTTNLDLYANYVATDYTITYNLDLVGATNAVDKVDTYTIEDNVTLLPAGCEGYAFNGWTNSTEVGTVSGWSAGEKTGNLEFFASWTINTYTVTYAAGDYSSEQTQSDTKTYGVDLTLEDALFNRDGYTQTGWSTASDGSTKDYDLEATYSVNAAITLYPYWTQNQTDPIPAIAPDASAADVAAAIAEANFTDSDVATLINGDATTYLAFKAWADEVSGYDEKLVVTSEYAAVSYKMKDVVASPTLFENEPEVNVTSIVPGTTCAVTFELKDGESTVALKNQAAAYVGKIFKGTSLTSSFTACTAEDITDISVTDGKATLTLAKPSSAAGFYKFSVE